MLFFWTKNKNNKEVLYMVIESIEPFVKIY